MTLTTDRSRAAAALAVALFVSTTTAGCQTTSTKKGAAAAGSTTAQGGAEPSGPKTEFHRQVGPEQEYNVHLELARVYESQENHEAAVTEYQKATDVCEKKGSILTHSPLGPKQHSLAQRRMGAALDRMGRFAQAEPHYLKALKLAPSDSKVWNDAGYSYYLQNRLADAERALKTADSLEPGSSRVLTNLGLTLAAQGKYDEALAALTRAAGPAVGNANLGYILAAMGKTDLAREHYNTAIKLQPEMAPARLALAKLDATPSNPPTSIASVKPAEAPTSTPTRPGAPPVLVPAPVVSSAGPVVPAPPVHVANQPPAPVVPPPPAVVSSAGPVVPAPPHLVGNQVPAPVVPVPPAVVATSSAAAVRPPTSRDSLLTRTSAVKPVAAPSLDDLPVLPTPLPNPVPQPGSSSAPASK